MEVEKKLQDSLLVDLERIERAKKTLNDPNSLEREKRESIRLLDLYREIAREYLDTEQDERAREILRNV